jgi:hypothetical protein
LQKTNSLDRVHLQYLGHPIANDPIYGNPNIFKSKEDVENATTEELIKRLEMMGKDVAASTLADEFAIKDTNITRVDGLENPRERWSGEICNECGTQLYLDPSPDEFEIWLHAWKYSGDGGLTKMEGEEDQVWSYEADIPEWGREDWLGTQRDSASSITEKRTVKDDQKK